MYMYIYILLYIIYYILYIIYYILYLLYIIYYELYIILYIYILLSVCVCVVYLSSDQSVFLTAPSVSVPFVFSLSCLCRCLWVIICTQYLCAHSLVVKVGHVIASAHRQTNHPSSNLLQLNRPAPCKATCHVAQSCINVAKLCDFASCAAPPVSTSRPCNAIDHNPQVAAEAHHTQQAQHSHQPDHAKKPKLGKLNCKAWQATDSFRKFRDSRLKTGGRFHVTGFSRSKVPGTS